jgi:hypothetical protein
LILIYFSIKADARLTPIGLNTTLSIAIIQTRFPDERVTLFNATPTLDCGRLDGKKSNILFCSKTIVQMYQTTFVH